MSRQNIDPPIKMPGLAKIRGWQLLLATFALLWIYRTTAKNLETDAINWPAWTVWFLLTILYRMRASNADCGPFPASHMLARSSAGAAILVSISSISIIRDGSISAEPPILLLSCTMGLYIISGLATLKRISRYQPLDCEKQSFSTWLNVWLPSGLGAVLVRDLRIIAFAFSPRRRRIEHNDEYSTVFTNHFVARPMLIALLAISLVELAVVHILLRSLSPWIVFAHLAFGAFFVLYLMGIIRSFANMPTTIEDGLLRVRMSVFFEAVSPVSNICAISRINTMPSQSAEIVANGAIFVAPNILIELTNEVEVERMFKPKHRARFIAIYVDDPSTFIASTS
ncbi:hypothetical protein [Sphingorhabdus sp.]|uniref:hypothetical protein n=1 Tax=Sphingorhabdus sp. TaxID=1902408 RepID=UPI00391AAC9C